MSKQSIHALEQQIADLKARWPCHSVPPALMAQLDDLEEALRRAIELRDEADSAPGIGQPVICFRPIGYVENDFAAPGGLCDCTALESRLVIDPSLVEG